MDYFAALIYAIGVSAVIRLYLTIAALVRLGTADPLVEDLVYFRTISNYGYLTPIAETFFLVLIFWVGQSLIKDSFYVIFVGTALLFALARCLAVYSARRFPT